MLKDFDRPLNDRGKRSALEMAKRIIDKKIQVDAFISSPAKRARKTAEIFIEEYGGKKSDLLFFEELYLAQSPVFSNVISKTNDTYENIAVFSHNSGITDFANTLTEAKIDNIPTCGVFAVKIKANSWQNLRKRKKNFGFLIIRRLWLKSCLVVKKYKWAMLNKLMR